jgi:hypothetical protein
MIARNAGTLLAMLAFSVALGCAKKVSDNECVETLAASIKAGASEVSANKALDECGFAHSLDLNSGTIVAVKRGQKIGAVRQDWSARIKLDDGHNVVSVKSEKVFTGP